MSYRSSGPLPSTTTHASASAMSPTNATVATLAPTPSPTPVLDHRFLPHIMDLIVAAAPPASLLVLRRTSREYHDRVDGILSQHLIIYDDKVRYVHPTFAEWESARLPYLYGLEAPRSASSHEGYWIRVGRCLGHARVVELFESISKSHFIMAPYGYDDDCVYANSVFRNVHTVKYHPFTRTVYNACNYGEFDVWSRLFPNVKTFVTRSSFDHKALATFPGIRNSVDRIVVTLGKLNHSVGMGAAIERDLWPTSAREVVIIFDIEPHTTRVADSDDEDSDDEHTYYDSDDEPREKQPVDWVVALIDPESLGRVRYTFVNLCEADPGCLQLPLHLSPSQVEEMVHCVIGVYLGHLQTMHEWSDAEVRLKEAAVETISLAEYQSRVGDQYRFETLYED